MKYVYAYCDPRKTYGKEHLGVHFEYEPFYIGKGNKSRIRIHLCPCRLRRERLPKSAKINKLILAGYEIPIVVCRTVVSDVEACQLESAFIDDIGRKDTSKGPLTNLTEGGEGSWEMSEDVKIKRSAAVLGITTEEYWNNKKAGKRRCSGCKQWKEQDEFYSKASSYCSTCWCNRQKMERDESLLSRCGGNHEAKEFFKTNYHLYRAIRNKMGLLEYFLQYSSGLRFCSRCHKWKPKEKIREILGSFCVDCSNASSRKRKKIKRDVKGQILAVEKIAGHKAARFIVQAAKRAKVNIDEYAIKFAQGKRYCGICAEWKEQSLFYRRADRASGSQSCCKVCQDGFRQKNITRRQESSLKAKAFVPLYSS